ncbi:MAG TPA: hypothetical protein VFW00_10335, partial [Rhodocyclaceae bacterium]|nr:hypothetical protein [Rhodocyclaceae bacterium]
MTKESPIFELRKTKIPARGIGFGLLIACFSIFTAPSSNATTVTNGDFESGSLNGWNVWGYADVVGQPDEHEAYIVNGIPNGTYDASSLGGTRPSDYPLQAFPFLQLPGG